MIDEKLDPKLYSYSFDRHCTFKFHMDSTGLKQIAAILNEAEIEFAVSFEYGYLLTTLRGHDKLIQHNEFNWRPGGATEVTFV